MDCSTRSLGVRVYQFRHSRNYPIISEFDECVKDLTQYATLIYLIKRFFGNSRGFLTSWELIVAILYNFLFFYLFLFKRDWGMGVTFFEIAHLVPVFFTTNNKSKFFYAKIVLAVLLSFFFWTRADII